MDEQKDLMTDPYLINVMDFARVSSLDYLMDDQRLKLKEYTTEE